MECLLCARRGGVAVGKRVAGIGLTASTFYCRGTEPKHPSPSETPFCHTGDPTPLPDFKPEQAHSFK